MCRGIAVVPMLSLTSLGMTGSMPGNTESLLWKSSGLKCTEHMPELDVGTHSLPFLSFPRFTQTNLVHCFWRFLASGRSSFRNGNLWTTIPFGISLILSQPATMQRFGISVFHLHDADTSKLQRSRRKRKTRPGIFNKCL